MNGLILLQHKARAGPLTTPHFARTAPNFWPAVSPCSTVTKASFHVPMVVKGLSSTPALATHAASCTKFVCPLAVDDSTHDCSLLWLVHVLDMMG